MKATTSMATMLITQRHSKASRMKALISAADRKSHEWRWQATVAFWISASFIMGSLLFILGGVGSTLRHVTTLLTDWQGTALVDYGYLAGGTYFTLGAYLGFFNVINCGNARVVLLESPPADDFWDAAYWGSLIYFIGALCFQVAVVSVVAVGPGGPHWVTLCLEYGAQAVGGLCFTIAAIIEFAHNRHTSWRENVWWLCALYLSGSILFLVAAGLAFGAALLEGEPVSTDLHRRVLVGGPDWDTGIETIGSLPFSVWAVDLPYIVGSFAFWIGAWVQWRMWRSDQFGLGLLSEVNAVFGSKRDSTRGRDEKGEAASMMVKTVYATLAVLDIGLAVAYDGSEGGQRELLSAGPRHAAFVTLDQATQLAADLVASHTLLLLATILHATPTIEPFNYLTWLLRAVELLWCTREALTIFGLLANEGM